MELLRGKRRLLCGLVAACGGGGHGASSDASPPGLDAGPHPQPPACTQLATLPMRTPTYHVDFAAGSDTGDYFEDNTSAFGSTAWIYLEFECRGFNIHHNVLNQSRSYYASRILGDGFQVDGDHIIASNVIANSNSNGSAGIHIMQSSGAADHEQHLLRR